MDQNLSIMKTLFIIIITTLLFSCNSDEKYGIIDETEVDSSILNTNPLFNADKDALSESLKAITKLIKIDGKHYSFNLSSDEAQHLGATRKEYNYVVEAVKYMNQEADKAREEGITVQIPSGNENMLGSLSRGNGRYTTFATLYIKNEITTLESFSANFTGPRTIIAGAGATSMAWSANFKEASKGIQFPLSGFIISSNEEREVTAPLSTPGQKTSWGWTINCGMGNGAHGYVLFKTPEYDPVNTSGSDDDLFDLPAGFDLRCDDYCYFDYNIQFQNYTAKSYAYEVTEYPIERDTRKGSIQSGACISMQFQKNRTYILKLKDSYNYIYEYTWYLSSNVQL